MPEFASGVGRLYHDFNKRAAAIRELFEECNLLLANNQTPLATQSCYLNTYKQKFPNF